MGKPEERRLGIPATETAAAASTDTFNLFVAGIRRAFSFRCVIVLLLSSAVLISAIFWFLPIIGVRSGFTAADDAASAEVQASFILQKPFSLLSSHVRRLEFDIFEEIGVPNTKVSIISMLPTAAVKSTFVTFGVLPETSYSSISLPALSLLRSSMIELVLQQVNLTLTPSVFGETLSFEVLKFPGGITVIPPQTSLIWESNKALFNFTVNNSILHIQQNLKELKDQLKFGLSLQPYENVYVQMTNLNGSTVAPPVTVQASILSNYGNDALLPNRLKELAQTIMASQLKNLGLNISVFGKVKTVVLTSYLNNSITCFETPSPSPSPSLLPSPLPSPSPSPSPFPSAAPCPSPSEEYSYNTDPYHTMSSPCSPPAYPSNSADSDHKEKEMPRSGYRRARAIFYETPLLVQDKESIKVSALTMTNSLFLSSSTSTSGSMSWFIFSAASFLLVLLSGLW